METVTQAGFFGHDPAKMSSRHLQDLLSTIFNIPLESLTFAFFFNRLVDSHLQLLCQSWNDSGWCMSYIRIYMKVCTCSSIPELTNLAVAVPCMFKDLLP